MARLVGRTTTRSSARRPAPDARRRHAGDPRDDRGASRPPASTSCSSRPSASASPRPLVAEHGRLLPRAHARPRRRRAAGHQEGRARARRRDRRQQGRRRPRRSRPSGAANELSAALHLVPPRRTAWEPPVLTCSALEQRGLDTVWAQLEAHRRTPRTTPATFEEHAQPQEVDWMWATVDDRLLTRFRARPAVRDRVAELEEAVRNGEITPTVAASELSLAGSRGSITRHDRGRTSRHEPARLRPERSGVQP